MKTIQQILNRYANSNLPPFKKIWGEIEKRWAEACLETFKQLPPTPQIISASQYSKIIQKSHVTAKKHLKSNSKFAQISDKLFVNKSTPYLPFIFISISSWRLTSPRGFVEGVEKLRSLPSDFIPTSRNLKKILGVHQFRSVKPILGFTKLFKNNGGKYLCFIPTFILNQLHSTPSNSNDGGGNGGERNET